MVIRLLVRDAAVVVEGDAHGETVSRGADMLASLSAELVRPVPRGEGRGQALPLVRCGGVSREGVEGVLGCGVSGFGTGADDVALGGGHGFVAEKFH